MVQYCDIMKHIERLEKGDIVYVNSDILELMKATRMNGERFDINRFIDSMIEVVGEEGTILIPTFNWDFCKGQTFDYWKTPSKTGALGNAALKREDFCRTKHPMYSFAVWGKDKEKLYAMDNPNAFGEDTIFDYLVQQHAKSLVIGLPSMKANTVLHHVEKVVGVPFRYDKEFTADYIDREGAKREATYVHYVRDLDMDAREATAPMNHILEVMNISNTQMINGIPFRTVLLDEMFQVIAMDIKYNDCRNIYRYKGQREIKKVTERYNWE